MDRADFLKEAAAGAVGLELVMAADEYRGEIAQAVKPNILLIMTDDQPYYTIGTMESFQERGV